MRTVAQIGVVLTAYMMLLLAVVGLAATIGIASGLAVDAFTWGWELT